VAPYSDELETSDLHRLRQIVRDVANRYAKEGRCFDAADVVSDREATEFGAYDVQAMVDELVGEGVLRECSGGGYEPAGS
jgi:hypothetical protein